MSPSELTTGPFGVADSRHERNHAFACMVGRRQNSIESCMMLHIVLLYLSPLACYTVLQLNCHFCIAQLKEYTHSFIYIAPYEHIPLHLAALSQIILRTRS